MLEISNSPLWLHLHTGHVRLHAAAETDADHESLAHYSDATREPAEGFNVCTRSNADILQ